MCLVGVSDSCALAAVLIAIKAAIELNVTVSVFHLVVIPLLVDY